MMPCPYCDDSHSAFDPCPESIEFYRAPLRDDAMVGLGGIVLKLSPTDPDVKAVGDYIGHLEALLGIKPHPKRGG